MAREMFLKRQRAVIQKLDALPWGADLIAVKPYEWLCGAEVCFAARNGEPWYSDNNHLTLVAAKVVARQIRDAAGR